MLCLGTQTHVFVVMRLEKSFDNAHCANAYTFIHLYTKAPCIRDVSISVFPLGSCMWSRSVSNSFLLSDTCVPESTNFLRWEISFACIPYSDARKKIDKWKTTHSGKSNSRDTATNTASSTYIMCIFIYSHTLQMQKKKRKNKLNGLRSLLYF